MHLIDKLRALPDAAAQAAADRLEAGCERIQSWNQHYGAMELLEDFRAARELLNRVSAA